MRIATEVVVASAGGIASAALDVQSGLMSKTERIGTHEVWVEPPDVMAWRLAGSVTCPRQRA